MEALGTGHHDPSCWEFSPMKVGQRYQNSSKVMLGMAPSQDASDHQDSYISTRESQPKPNFATIASWAGATPTTWDPW